MHSIQLLPLLQQDAVQAVQVATSLDDSCDLSWC
jgi:hypothetical protein